MSFNSVLVANRGEIALRIIEACRELGVVSIAVCSEADARMPYLKLADASVCIGPPEPARSYLNIAAIISAAELTGAEAIHPGYGFLAENPHFVEVCEEHGLVFVGPPREVMALLGDKLAAREAAARAGVSVLPGEPVPPDSADLPDAGERVGYPLLVKSVYGGGGRGMRWVNSPEELAAACGAAASEARAACGDASLYLERAVPNARHVEVQVLADGHGSVVHLGERECSIQRRHQKLIEESPAPRLTAEVRTRLHDAAVTAASAVHYRNAGTVEFVLTEEQSIYFIEMNARIQVEHPVSEVVSGVNLVKEQLRIAAGELLPPQEESPLLQGHAIECRLNAEDPTRNMIPCAGTVHIEELPGGAGVRLDTALHDGMRVSPFYDSLLAKLITWGHDREEARVRMRTALQRFRISGVSTTRDLLLELVSHHAFQTAELTTDFLERFFSDGSVR
jgi:acetyl-CoA carboxylase biotin carboxylase subunit